MTQALVLRHLLYGEVGILDCQSDNLLSTVCGVQVGPSQ